ncbi:hypothetical protein DM02DRAFT_719112 [Periconia macrospinosa]|uniref:AMP-dependent synthetase/ligase domain-containing protein n=1 Tax=Periconia macrospinosa TaxID=97972 RepID=A0A2V1DNZ4_9PLEO|nr:hypothetical protein DM02DRAFT_719112 [Periconia macrospinosa]
MPHASVINDANSYTIPQILTIARQHPFYSPVKYPPSRDFVEDQEIDANLLLLRTQPIIRKKDLYATITRLITSTHPSNTYNSSAYISVTGGGGGTSNPLYFSTDAFENRAQRASFGRLVNRVGVLGEGDVVLTTHSSGHFYRSLDLMLEIIENASASAFAASNHMTPAEIIANLISLPVNTLTGDASQVVQTVHAISSLSSTDRARIRLEKIVYTSEAFTKVQREYVREVLGRKVRICSIIGSAEAGPWGVSGEGLSWGEEDVGNGGTDFLVDRREMIVEIVPLDTDDQTEEENHAKNGVSNARGAATEEAQDSEQDKTIPHTLPQGEIGLVLQTSLVRLRNPLIRYMTGDVGSLHPLPPHAQSIIPADLLPHLYIVRIYGRDARFSLTWNGEYIEFAKIKAVMTDKRFGVLQWQVILDRLEGSREAAVEVRVLKDWSTQVGTDSLEDTLKKLFVVFENIEYRFQIVYVKDLNGFERSSTGRKVIKFLDRSDR